ncbi:MAG TPA: plastocyanin/azurin family copper-binding protein [Gemmatimonadaceae bacterium]|nr:plastocyanin/azurin family copper-binding protein [Gemmatimonadaceae bacterium]
MFAKRLALAVAIAFPAAGNAQSLLDRTPNVSGDWVGVPGTLYFHFIHRFVASDAPQRKVSNVPTFLLAAGLPKHFLAGFNYSTNSTLAPNFPNEWELFARWQPLSEDFGNPVSVGGQVGYNNAAEGVDGELSVAKRIGPARLIAAGRALSDPFEKGNVRFAVAGGATFRLGQYVALAGDVGTMTDRDSAERVSWSAGVHIAIPLTPHTLSLHATNAPIATLQDASRGSSTIRYGFEFTIPLTLKRYFGKRAKSAPDTVVSALTAPQVDTADSVEKPAVTTAPAPNPTAIVEPIEPVLTVPTPAAPPADTVKKSPAPAKVTQPAPSKPVAKKPAPRAASVRKTTIKNISYLQPKITVTVGTTVEWTNADPLQHTVTAVDKSFNSGLIDPGKTFRHTFTKAGTFNFYCMPHPFMKGVIVVTDK